MYRTIGKPVFDYFILLIILAPVSALCILIVGGYIICGEWPVLFKQPRVGRAGKVFNMMKFRTLDVDIQKPLMERRFAWGSFLRLSNLDELPQLLNVLKGEMSLIGPRPLPAEYQTLFSMEQNRRHEVLPGITGLAQVNGKNSSPWPDKFKYDLQYVDRVSLRLDVTILVKTVILVLSLKKDNSLNEEKFTG